MSRELESRRPGDLDRDGGPGSTEGSLSVGTGGNRRTGGEMTGGGLTGIDDCRGLRRELHRTFVGRTNDTPDNSVLNLIIYHGTNVCFDPIGFCLNFSRRRRPARLLTRISGAP